MERLQKVVREINVWLLAVAIGLGALDATVFLTVKLPIITAERARAEKAGDGDTIPSRVGSPVSFWID